MSIKRALAYLYDDTPPPPAQISTQFIRKRLNDLFPGKSDDFFLSKASSIQEVFQFLSTNLCTPTDSDPFDEAFNDLCSDGSGIIDFDRVESVLFHSLGKLNVDDRRILLDILDKDDDEIVGYTDFKLVNNDSLDVLKKRTLDKQRKRGEAAKLRAKCDAKTRKRNARLLMSSRRDRY